MKSNVKKFGIIALVIVVGFAVITCGNPNGFGDGANNQGTILINLGSKNSDIRSVMPWPSEDSEILEYIDYKITFKGSGTTKTITAKNGETKKESVSAGLWTITIDAYLEGFQTPLTPNGERMHYATGGNSINVKAGKTNEVSLPMTAEFCRDCDWVITLAACTVPHKVTVEKCTNNNHIGVERIISGMLGHKWEYLGVAPTCTTAGSGTQKCEVCKIEETNSVIPPLGHKWEYFGIAPTCTTAGSGTQKCEICKIEETLTIIDPLEHNWSNWTVISTTYPAQSSRTCIHGCIDTRDTQIGDTGPAGGIIFYVADGQEGRPTGFTVVGYTGTLGSFPEYTAYYLEAAPIDSEPSIWTSSNSLLAGITTLNYPANIPITFQNQIGNGRRDTQIIVNTGQMNTAAQRASTANFGNKNDWFLPSFDELALLFLNRDFVGNFTGGITDGNMCYWSSSQLNFDWALAITFNVVPGNQTHGLKNSYYYSVRAIRAF